MNAEAVRTKMSANKYEFVVPLSTTLIPTSSGSGSPIGGLTGSAVAWIPWIGQLNFVAFAVHVGLASFKERMHRSINGNVIDWNPDGQHRIGGSDNFCRL